MNQKDIATPARTREIMQQYGLFVKKSLGQNFLIEPNILTKIIDAVQIDKATNVIEIGPGIGALTERIAREANHVLAFEIDGRLIPILEDTLSPYSNVTVIHEDILKVPLKETIEQIFDVVEKKLLVVANLPYYITTPIIMNLLESRLPIDGFAMMMQKEVAQRMTAQPNTKAYGSLTIAIQYWCEAKIGFIVPRSVFNPMPNVDSAVLLLNRRNAPLVDVLDEEFFFDLVRNSFVQRRKTLWNNLLTAYGRTDEIKNTIEKGLEMAQIDPKRRAESLTIQEFSKLANVLHVLKDK